MVNKGTEIERINVKKSWQMRSKHGRDKIFADAQLLLSQAFSYFDWCDRHPEYKVELVKYKGGYDIAEVPLGRPYTVNGLTKFLGVSEAYFRGAENNLLDKIAKGKNTPAEVDLLDAIEYIKSTIRDQQISGAAVGIFKEGIIARLNGLSENVNSTGSGTSIVRITVRDDETRDNLDALTALL